MWKTTEMGGRVSVVRVKEALQTAPDHIVSACPYCLLMFEEAVQTVTPEKTVTVSDIAEVVQRNIR
jgi:Fe-S oxidoreductase